MNRNKNLDILKAISVYCVISAHTTVIFMQDYWYSLIRIAVPLFFMISGYYAKDEAKYNLRRIKKCMSLLILCELLYLFLYWVFNEYYKFEYLKLIKIGNVLTGNFAIWNHGWYLLSLSYIYIINLIICKFKHKHYIMIILVLLGLFALYYGEYINRMKSDIFIYTHVIAKGIPFFFGARLLKDYNDKIKIPVKITKLLVPVSTIGILVERYILLTIKGSGGRYLFIGTPILVFSLFYIAIRSDNYNLPFFNYVGKNLSMLMYCIHLALIDVLYHLNLECESFSLYFVSAAVAYVLFKLYQIMIIIIKKSRLIT